MHTSRLCTLVYTGGWCDRHQGLSYSVLPMLCLLQSFPTLCGHHYTNTALILADVVDQVGHTDLEHVRGSGKLRARIQLECLNARNTVQWYLLWDTNNNIIN